MPSSYLTDHQTALREADEEAGVPETVDVWKRTLEPGDYAVDTERSKVEFAVRMVKLLPVEGTFVGLDGHVRLTEPIEESSVELTIDPSTVDTGIALRDTHLRSSLYLDAERYPQMRFVSEHVQPLGRDTYAVHGRFTVKDTTEPAVFHVTLIDTYERSEDTVVRFVATAEVDRRAFGVPSPEAVALWGLVADRAVTVRLHITARRPKDD